MISSQMLTNWEYRGEGNCNVVLALPDKRKVLRIRKLKQPQSFIFWLINWLNNLFLSWYDSGKVDQELRDLMFYRRVMRPLLGLEFVCDAEQLILNRKEILSLNVHKFRPNYRKKSLLQSGRAALFHDYAFLPDNLNVSGLKLSKNTFAIEIKPKQGWTPSSEKRSNNCSYCMKQYLKLRDRQIVNLSSYCPEDLFSGENARMIKAIKALIINPQNNFRVFKNGQLFYGENFECTSFNKVLEGMFESCDTQLEEEFCFLIQKCLTKKFVNNNCDNNCKNCFINTKLSKGCVLERILCLQKLNFYGNECYYRLLENRKLNDYSYVQKLLDKLDENPNNCLKCLIMSLKDDELDDLFFMPYLISTIAKDCSIMLTFQRIEDHLSDYGKHENVISTDYGNFLFNIGIFDLYPKPMSTIQKYKRKIDEMFVCSTNQI